MICWKCLKSIEKDKIGFRDVCQHCGSDLHTCTDCRYYAPGKPNDCLVPGTDFVRDRETANFCEEFKPRTESKPPSSSEKSRRILGEPEKKKTFQDLFPDEG